MHLPYREQDRAVPENRLFTYSTIVPQVGVSNKKPLTIGTTLDANTFHTACMTILTKRANMHVHLF